MVCISDNHTPTPTLQCPCWTCHEPVKCEGSGTYVRNEMSLHQGGLGRFPRQQLDSPASVLLGPGRASGTGEQFSKGTHAPDP